MKSGYILLFYAALVQFTACSKDAEDNNSTPIPTVVLPGTVPDLGDADGIMVAILSKTYSYSPIGSILVPVGTAVAVFSDTAGSSSFVSAGVVECEGNFLAKQANNSYVFTPSATAPTGIDFGSVNNPAWEVQGSGVIP